MKSPTSTRVLLDDVASQGDTVAEARENLQETLTLFFKTASADEIDKRLRGDRSM